MSPPFLRRTNTPTCFFCLSAVSPAPLDVRSYRCPHCGCWNRYDANGEIISDEPAMHDEKLNEKSFAKRASPSKDKLPSMYGTGQFCHTCQTNQMLLVNLLSNYLPPPQHPDYAKRLERLPAYRESLYIRYPPVCENCLPSVEDEIERKNQMARTKALGGWLKESKGKDRQRVVSGSGNARENLELQLTIWRARGALWWVTLVGVLAAHTAAVRGYDFPRWLAGVIPILPVLAPLSLFYTAWDPTYYRFKRARVQGRDVRVKGKTSYIILQMLSWISRLVTSFLLGLSWHSVSRDYLHTFAYPFSYRVRIYSSISLVIELLVFASSFTILHLQKPPPIRLIETSTRSSSVRATPDMSSSQSARASPMPLPPSEPDLFASLTLSSTPLVPSANPIFGHPSLVPPATSSGSQGSPIKVDEISDEDAMDWTPTNPSPIKHKKATNDDDGSWLHPQRFFPPERPTGLETLFANTKLDDADARSSPQTRPIWCNLPPLGVLGRWIGVCTVLLIPIGAIAYQGWIKRRTVDGYLGIGISD